MDVEVVPSVVLKVSQKQQPAVWVRSVQWMDVEVVFSVVLKVGQKQQPAV